MANQRQSTPRADKAGELLAQAGLADAGLAGEHDQRSVDGI
jgi:hypothetical protein